MKKLKLLLTTVCFCAASLFAALLNTAFAQTNTLKISYLGAASNSSLTIPEGVKVKMEAWGGGGGGGCKISLATGGAAGGGGGGYLCKIFTATATGNASFAIANGGSGGDGSGLIGDNGHTGESTVIIYDGSYYYAEGGTGGAGTQGGGDPGGSGGGFSFFGSTPNLGFSGVIGGYGKAYKSGCSGAGGNGGGAGGGAGGEEICSSTNDKNNGRNGTVPGGGGSGAYNSLPGNGDGGHGADGAVIFTLDFPTPVIRATSNMICMNKSVTLSVENLSSSVVYKWYQNGIWVATGPNHMLTAGEGGTYTVRAEYPISTIGVSDFEPLLPPDRIFRTTDSNSIVITEAPTMILNNITITGCSGDNFIVTPVNGVHGSFPEGTIYSWTQGTFSCVSGSNILYGTGPFTFSSSNGTIVLGQITNNCSVSQGSIAYTVTPYYNGCAGNTFTLTVNVNQRPEINSPITYTACSGEYVNINPDNDIYVSVPDGTRYAWEVINSGNINLESPTGNGLLISLGKVINTTGYRQTVTYKVTPIANGCAGDDFLLELTVQPEFTVTLLRTDIINNNIQCSGVSTNFRVQGGNPTSTYSWYIDGQLYSSSTYMEFTLPTLLPRAEPYNIHVLARSGNCTAISNSYALTIKEKPTVKITTNYTDICPGGSIITTANVSPTDSYDYTWYLDGVAGGYQQQLNISNLPVGTHTLYVNVAPGAGYPNCAVNSASVTLTVHNNPIVTIAADNTPICAGESAIISVANIALDPKVRKESLFTYQWALNGTIINGATLNSYSQIAAGAGTYEYQLRMVQNDGLGCASDWSAPATVTVEALPQVSLTVDNGNYCDGSSAILTAAVTPAGIYTYDWYLDDVFVTSGSNSFTSTGLAPRVTAYNYHVVVSSALSCEGKSNKAEVKVKEVPTVNVSINHADICLGGNLTATADVTPVDAYNYIWYLDGVAGGYQQQFNMNNLSAGSHTVYVEVSPNAGYNGCAVTGATETFVVHANPVVSIDADNTVLCAGETVSLYTDNISIDNEVDGAYSYQWALNGIEIPGAIMSSYSQPLPTAGSYEYTLRIVVNNALGCASDWSNAVNITVNEAPSVILTGDNSGYCENSSGLLTAIVSPVGNYDYDWYLDDVLVASNNSNHFISTGLPPRPMPYNYKVVVRTLSNCEGTSNELGITVVAVPTVTVTANNTEFCHEGNVTLTASTAPAGNYDSFGWQWAVDGTVIRNATQDTYSQMLDGGIYTFTARMVQNGDLGCASEWSAPVNVIVKHVEVPPFFTSDCDEGSIATYRTARVPITVHTISSQNYTTTFIDAAFSSFNYTTGIIGYDLHLGAYIDVRLPLKAGDYNIVITIDGCEYKSTGRVFADNHALGGAKLIEQRWTDVLVVNNNPTTNGGFTFYSYQWYKNGESIPGANEQNYTEPGGRLNGSYHVVLNGYAILSPTNTVPVSYVSCPFVPSAQFSMTVYPVPVAINQPLTFSTSLTTEELRGATLEIYDLTGRMVRTMTNLSPEMSIPGFNSIGMYVGRVTTKNNGTMNLQFVVQ